MFRKILPPLLALMGLGFSVFMINHGAKKPPVTPIPFVPPRSPYQHYIAGEGIIESAYKNILVAPSFSDLITDIYCEAGQIVERGDRLFKLDTRQLEAQRVAALEQEKAAAIDYENQKEQFSFYERLEDKSAVSELVYKAAFYNKELAQQRLEVAKAAVRMVETDIERSTTRAPIKGEILQINIRVGQFANANPFDKTPLILLGDTSVCHVRIDIDEEDAWRFIPGALATGFVRGNSKIFIPLEFVYLEPYVIPKTSLSGSDTERVDTRVLQVIYKFNKNDYPVFMGQILDIYIQAKPNGAA